MPLFGRLPALGGAGAVRYADDDPLRTLGETLTDAVTARGLPEDGMAGCVYVEKRLDRRLAGVKAPEPDPEKRLTAPTPLSP